MAKAKPTPAAKKSGAAKTRGRKPAADATKSAAPPRVKKPKAPNAPKPGAAPTQLGSLTTEAIVAAVRTALREHDAEVASSPPPAIRLPVVRSRGSNGAAIARAPKIPASLTWHAGEPLFRTSTATRGAAIERAPAAWSAFPNAPGLDNAMCRLECDYPGGTWVGSGVMIGPRRVLTVAHNLFNKFVPGRVAMPIDRVTVSPGAHLGMGRSATAEYARCWHPPEWIPFASASNYENHWRDPSPHDYGVINLPTDTDWGDAEPIGWAAIDDEQFPSDWFQQAAVYLFGYPLEYSVPIFPAKGGAAPYDVDYLTYNMIGENGMSGGPMFAFYETENGYWALLLAIQSMTFHAGTSSAYSLGVRVGPQVASKLTANFSQ